MFEKEKHKNGLEEEQWGEFFLVKHYWSREKGTM
jgi:hypothetical protein